MNSPYSQLNQDLWVIDVLKHKKNGIFVDVGTFDGVNLSNTYILEKDYKANNVTFKKIQQSRKCIYVNEMLSNEMDEIIPLQHFGELSLNIVKQILS